VISKEPQSLSKLISPANKFWIPDRRFHGLPKFIFARMVVCFTRLTGAIPEGSSTIEIYHFDKANGVLTQGGEISEPSLNAVYPARKERFHQSQGHGSRRAHVPPSRQWMPSSRDHMVARRGSSTLFRRSDRFNSIRTGRDGRFVSHIRRA
jgi:hypothetical protein